MQLVESKSVKRGSVYLIKTSYPDETIRTNKHSKFAVVLTKNIGNSKTINVLHLTSKTQKLYPLDVYVPEAECGCSGGAKVICNQMHTITTDQIQACKYTLSLTSMKKI